LNLLIFRTPPYLDIEVSSKRLQPGEKAKIVCTFSSSQKNTYGFFYDRIKALITNQNSRLYKDLFVSATILPFIDASNNRDLQEYPKLYFPYKEKVIEITKNTLKAQTDFKFENHGKSDLEILDIHINKGCEIKNYNKLVKPGQSGVITIICDDVSECKNYKKVIDIISNDPLQIQTSLKIDYKCISKDN